MKVQKYKLNNASQRRTSRNLNHGIIKLCRNILAIGIMVFIVFFLYPSGLLTDFEGWYRNIYQTIDFKLENISIKGTEKVSLEKLHQLPQLKVGVNLLEIDLANLYNDIKQEPWVKSVSIKRQFPNSIYISIEEETPYALYNDNNKMFLITKNGKILEETDPMIKVDDYLVISGVNANLNYDSLLDVIYEYPDIYNKLQILEKIGDRRWNLKLEDNIIIKLPEHNIALALGIFYDLFKKIPGQLSYIVDLRLIPDKIYIKII